LVVVHQSKCREVKRRKRMHRLYRSEVILKCVIITFTNQNNLVSGHGCPDTSQIILVQV